jgi:hypothetical protein
MRLALPLTLILVILLAGTYVQGHRSDRWGRASSERLIEFTERLKDVPMQVGDWVGRDEPVKEDEFEASNCEGYVSRTYRNREGQEVNVYLVSGKALHVTIHTPDWCYVGAGYEKHGDPVQYELPVEGMEVNPEFLTTTFVKEEPLSKHELRVFWSFSDDGTWKGPRIPKAEFSGRPALFKIYLITDLSQVKDDGIETNPSFEFAKAFMPEINKILFGKKDEPIAPVEPDGELVE